MKKLKLLFEKFKSQKLVYIIIEIVVLLAIIAGLIFLLWPKKDNEVKIDNKVEEPEKPKVQIVDVNSKSRPYAVMINNISTARPLQSGLQDAYIMYEMIVEGGITRYLALFLDANTERIGSVRSARHYYLDYALENDAFYCHHGQSPQAARDFSALKVDRIEVSNSTGWRDKSLKVSSEHTLFTSTDLLKKGIGNKRVERNNDLLFEYSADPIDLTQKEGASPASSVSIKYSNNTTTSYTYNETEKVYYRFVNNKEHKDYVTGNQYHFKNIITYQVENYTLNDGENKGRQDLKNVGEGEGYYISNGNAVKIKWSKECRSCQTKYTYISGEELILNDGNTFIQIQPKGQPLNIS